MVKKVVWKYDIPIQEYFTLEIPFGAEILHFGLQYGITRIWVLVEPSREKAERRFRLAGTGYNISEEGLKYIGTIKMLDDKLIYHLFEY